MSEPYHQFLQAKKKFLKLCIFKFGILEPIKVLFWVYLWVFSEFGIVVLFWQLNL